MSDDTEQTTDETPLQRRKREVAERAEAIAKKRAEREELYALDVAERDLKDREALEALEAEKGPIAMWGATISAPVPPPLPGLVILRRQSNPEWKAWQAIAANPKSSQRDKDEGMRDLARSMVAYPDRKTYEEILKVASGLHVAIVAEASRMSGIIQEERGKG